MNSIRKLITTQSIAQRAFRPSPSSIISQSRSVVYLHKGARVRGLVRDEEDYLNSPKGNKYGATPENLQNIQKFLGEEYQLPNELALQVLTHKSFAHGIKPFNEKLSILGAHFLKAKLSLYSVNNLESQNPNEIINGLSLDRLGSFTAKNLNSSNVMYEFIKSNDLVDSIFWKKRDPLLTNPTTSGEVRVSGGVLNAILGAILSQHGINKAEKFINEVLLNSSNEKSLVNLAKKF